ncbi:serine/threonine-protein kinase Vhs1p [Trichomonascus vanleenenianus]|uniref:putative serine/threonine protein kinase VHS1 n=1 Tax=Trichomonascus vanleenenianus TaxID=2268995 RepID=UPI003ECA2F3F
MTMPNDSPIATTTCRIGKMLNAQIQLTAIIGSGAYGVVYSGIDIINNRNVAVKALPKLAAPSSQSIPQSVVPGKHLVSNTPTPSDFIDATPVSLETIALRYICHSQKKRKPMDSASRRMNHRLSRVYKEIALHALCHNHPNVATIRQVLDSNDCIYLVLDYFPTGDLFHAITDLKWYVADDIRARSIFAQLVDAIAYCHSQGVYHCDLKPENILVSNDGSKVQIADFGLATCSAFSSEYGCGSSFYMSPERLENPPKKKKGFDSASSDVWALGVILLNLVCGRNPWKRASFAEDKSYAMFCMDSSRTFLENIMPISPQLAEILSRVFSPDPSDRPSVKQFAHQVFACSSLSSVPQQRPVPVVMAAAHAAVFASFKHHQHHPPHAPAPPALQDAATVSSPLTPPSPETDGGLLPPLAIVSGPAAKTPSRKRKRGCDVDNNEHNTSQRYGLLSPAFTPTKLHSTSSSIKPSVPEGPAYTPRAEEDEEDEERALKKVRKDRPAAQYLMSPLI